MKLPKLQSVDLNAKKKKKILLLSDDLRMSSGVGTMSREFVMGTLHHYDWVQVGGAIKHPEEGKVVDMKQAIKDEIGVDGYLKIYPISGYGNSDILRQIMKVEKPDAVVAGFVDRYLKHIRRESLAEAMMADEGSDTMMYLRRYRSLPMRSRLAVVQMMEAQMRNNPNLYGTTTIDYQNKEHLAEMLEMGRNMDVR